jgi:predicted transcriptional regulator
MRTINPLDAPLGTSRQKVLSRTHLQPERWWYLHELARSLNLRPSSIQRDAAILVAAGILIRRKDGNRV